MSIQGIHQRPVQEPTTPPVQTTTKGQPTQPKPPVGESEPAKGITNFGALGAPSANAATAQQRTAAARQAIASLARDLDGHGVNLDQLVQQYASDRHAGMSEADVRTHARNEFLRAAVGQHPELADKAIALRLRGLAPERQAIVREAVKQSGCTGLNRVMMAETALAELRGFEPVELGDIQKMMRAGMRFKQAVATERAELARPVPTPVQLPNGAGAMAQQARQLQILSHAMNAANRELSPLTRGSEVIVGGASMLTTGANLVGAAGRSTPGDVEPLKAAADDAELSVGLVAGELTDKIGQAKAHYHAFNNAHIAYCDLHQQYKRAWESNDYPRAASLAKQMNALAATMKQEASAYEALAKNIGQMDKRFDIMARHTAIHVALSAVSVGAGAGAGHAQTGLAESLEATAHTTVENRVGHGISSVMEH